MTISLTPLQIIQLALVGIVIILLAIVLVVMLTRQLGSGGSVDVGGLFASLQGHKTEILGSALLAVDQANNLGWINDVAAAKIDKVIYALIAFTIHAAIKRTEQAQQTSLEHTDLIVQTMPIVAKRPMPVVPPQPTAKTGE